MQCGAQRDGLLRPVGAQHGHAEVAFDALGDGGEARAAADEEDGVEGGGGLSQNEMLGLLDTLFLFCYSAGLYGSGYLADRHDLRVVSSIGLALSAALLARHTDGGVLYAWDEYNDELAFLETDPITAVEETEAGLWLRLGQL